LNNPGEAKFWRVDLRLPFRELGHYNRLESHATAVGRPDINLCMDSNVVWDIELKYVSDWSRGIIVRPAQRAWMLRRKRVGGKCCFLTKLVYANGDKGYILNMSPPETPDVMAWVEHAEVYWADKIDFVELEELLRAEK
jgi:hypothetical protein